MDNPNSNVEKGEVECYELQCDLVLLVLDRCLDQNAMPVLMTRKIRITYQKMLFQKFFI